MDMYTGVGRVCRSPSCLPVRWFGDIVHSKISRKTRHRYLGCCPSCGKKLGRVANSDNLMIVGCRGCYYSAVIDGMEGSSND